MTKFTTKGWLIMFTPIMFALGTWAFIILFQNISTKSQDKITSMYFVVPIISLVFFGLPFTILMYKRTIVRDNGLWIISYLILKRQIQFHGNDIKGISITENVRGRSVPNHEIMRIKIDEDWKVEITSLEIKNYSKFKELILNDFKGKVIIIQFG